MSDAKRIVEFDTAIYLGVEVGYKPTGYMLAVDLESVRSVSQMGQDDVCIICFGSDTSDVVAAPYATVLAAWRAWVERESVVAGSVGKRDA